MLKPEQARQKLTELASPRHLEARVARLKKLPKADATAGLAALGRKPDGRNQTDYKEKKAGRFRGTAHLEAKPGDRAKVFATLFPTIAQEMEDAWQLFMRLPYTVGYTRRAFRAPTRPAAYRQLRSNWIEGVTNALATYPDDAISPDWIAAWSVHIDQAHWLGYLLAGVIDRGGATSDAVFEIVKDCASSRHEIGGPSRHVTRALLCCKRPEAWEFTENLLRAAQRQEGLRQTILEAVDEAHPQAFHRMIDLVLREDLLRFSSVARAASVWLGENQSALEPKKLKSDLLQIQALLGSAAERDKAIAKGDAMACYRGLWAIAYEDVEKAVRKAAPILKEKDIGRRFAAGMLISRSGLPEASKLLFPLLDDADLRLVSLALGHFRHPVVYGEEDSNAKWGRPAKLFERLEKLIPRLPEEPSLPEPPAPGWCTLPISQEIAADLMPVTLDDRNPERLIPYVPVMGEYTRVRAIELLAKPRTLTAQVRELFLTVAGHPSGNLREAAFKGLKKCKIAEDEAQTLEGYLTRKNADLRRGLFELLLNRTDKAAVGSVIRLMAAKDGQQRLAAIELARRLVEANRQKIVVQKAIAAYRDNARKLGKPEAEAIEAVLHPPEKLATLEDCLGLIAAGARTPPTTPKKRSVQFATPAAVAFVKELDAFIHEHRDRTFMVVNRDKSTSEHILGSAHGWQIPEPDNKRTAEQDRENYPLRELFEGWWQSRSAKSRDRDGLEVVRAAALKQRQVREGEEALDEDEDDDDPDEKIGAAERTALKELNALSPVTVKYGNALDRILPWILKYHPPEKAAEFLLAATESSLALVPHEVIVKLPNPEEWHSRNLRENSDFVRWVEMTRTLSSHGSIAWKPEHAARFYGLLRWLDEPGVAIARHRAELDELLAAYAAGAATVADFIDDLIGHREVENRWHSTRFSSFSQLTAADVKLPATIAKHADLRAALDACRERVLEVELARGESPSAATKPAQAISALYGQATLFRLLKALGKTAFAKLGYSVGEGKPAVLTQLIRNCHPLADDTPEEFARLAKAAIADEEIPEERIQELALLNPRWVAHVEQSLGWKGFSEAVWWFIAHTASQWDKASTAGDEDAGEAKKNDWADIVKARTNLTAEQRAEGVIDVVWFHAAYKAVGNDRRWDAIETAAKFLDFSQGHKKAARLADVLLGRTKKKELIEGIRLKNLKEYVRLLGLLPLPEAVKPREAELLDRHKVLKEYERYARGLSSMSREPALQAARLGLENLAVTAGYPDPLRLEWAVGAKAIADLRHGSAIVTVKNLSVELAVTPLGGVELTQSRDGKPLKVLPPDAKKNPKVAELLERKNSLTKSAASNKRSLELAMCQSDSFTGEEVQHLMDHALVRPLIERLVLQTDRARGYPIDNGQALRDWRGKATRIQPNDKVIVAHPLDLLAAGDWHDWQAECFRNERLQPFKQIFREVYTVTAQEKDDGTKSQRYAGQQLNPNQAMALFGARGWSTKDGVIRLFREAGLVAGVQFDSGWSTPGEVEGLTFHSVQFHRHGDWKSVLLQDVPAKVFSEVMRDLDLVVSVAHVGGVDPEASASTVEMRGMLLRETCTLLKIDNVKLDSRHALIKGTLGSYSVHLGSGVVHKQPGGAMCIVPVHSQHRGRLFLPFADDDPRTAEVVSKVLLLSRDNEIQDPTILEQIAGR